MLCSRQQGACDASNPFTCHVKPDAPRGGATVTGNKSFGPMLAGEGLVSSERLLLLTASSGSTCVCCISARRLSDRSSSSYLFLHNSTHLAGFTGGLGGQQVGECLNVRCSELKQRHCCRQGVGKGESCRCCAGLRREGQVWTGVCRRTAAEDKTQPTST